MAVKRARTHKHFQLDAMLIKRAQKALRTKTETETIERALDRVIAEERRNRVLRDANEEFFRSGIEIKDVYGVLDEACWMNRCSLPCSTRPFTFPPYDVESPAQRLPDSWPRTTCG